MDAMRESISTGPEAATARSLLEREYVSIFSELADLFGNPRSHGAIYGVLFSSERPLSMDEIVTRLGISKGSASQGLRQLEELGAILRAREDGERTHTYEARIELKPLIAGFLRRRLTLRLGLERRTFEGSGKTAAGVAFRMKPDRPPATEAGHQVAPARPKLPAVRAETPAGRLSFSPPRADANDIWESRNGLRRNDHGRQLAFT